MATAQITRRDFVRDNGDLGRCIGGSWAPAIAAGGSANERDPNDIDRRRGAAGTSSWTPSSRRPRSNCGGRGCRRPARRRDGRAHQERPRETRPTTARDYRAMLDRKDVDAVIIATPDHWHALPAIQAVLAGKDVYVEKPVGHNVAEGQAMIRAARKTNKIMAVGTQQRSSSHFQKAVEIVRSGKLGKIFWVQTWNYENISPIGMGKYPDCEAPSYVDYERWLGPAPHAAVQPQPIPPALPLVLRLRRRHDERLGRPSQRHRALGARMPRDRSRSTPPVESSPPTTTATRPTRCRSSTSSPNAR